MEHKKPGRCSVSEPSDFHVYAGGDLPLQNGGVLRDAQLAYATYGELSQDKDNVVLYAASYAARHTDIDWLVGDGMVLDPSRYFVIIPHLLGNGCSSSPSNTPAPFDAASFPNITILDNVMLQHRLVTDELGIGELQLVTGWSMGAAQTYQWAVTFPDVVLRMAPFCGSARTSVQNIVALEGARAAVQADSDWRGGRYSEPPTVGLRAMGRVFAGWSLTRHFYEERMFRHVGFPTLEDFLVAVWEGFTLSRDANDLLSMLWTWQNADVAVGQESLAEALQRVTAAALVMPAQGDLFFSPAAEATIVEKMTQSEVELRVIPSAWGHFAGSGINDTDARFISDAIMELLQR